MTILAIDLGTQSIKAAIVSKEGTIISKSQIQQEVSNPKPGWAQQKPDLWWFLTKKVIKDLFEKSNIDRSSIKAISCCGQMHGPVGIDKNGDITTEWTQIWCDKRGNEICKQVNESFDELELKKLTGNPINTGWSSVKVRWIKENQPQVYEKTQVFLVPKDFINYQLTGIIATDYSEASGTYLYDIRKDNYSDEMAKIMDLDLNKFAPIYKSYESIGVVKQEIVKEFEIPPETPVIAGGGDFIVSLLGLGLVGKGTAVDMTGTSTLFVVKRDTPIIDPAIQNLHHVLDGWLPFTILDCGGLAMKWGRDFLSSVSDNEISYKQLIESARKIPIGSNGLLFYPYLLGDRRQENAEAQGCFFGFNLNHTTAHFFRSIMEGVAFAIGRDVENFRRLDIKLDKVYCVGGTTRNKLLYEIKANVLNIPLILTEEPEASLLSCGLLASYGLGFIKDLNEIIQKRDREKLEILPTPDDSLKYKDCLERFKRMYDHLFGYWS